MSYLAKDHHEDTMSMPTLLLCIIGFIFYKMIIKKFAMHNISINVSEETKLSSSAADMYESWD
jgi:hypothetical protein